MSDYMFMLESHLSADQNRALDQVQSAAGVAGVNLFLTGGGMRDMLGGFRIRDLDFSVEGPALKVAKALQEQGARALSIDEQRGVAELVFPSGVTAQVAMSRSERYARTGAKPQIAPASIQEDLRGRDFTVNAMALSLNRASRGLLLDPTNGLADLGRRELRTTSPYVFYNDPIRLFRLVRLRVRLSFTVEERTAMQYQNARESRVQEFIPPRALLDELKRIAAESSPSEILQQLDQDGLLALFSPALTGAKLNLQGIGRLEKAAKLAEAAGITPIPSLPAFLSVLTAAVSAKDRSGLFKTLEVPKAELEALRSLDPRVRKLEQALKSARVKKPSKIYQILAETPVEDIVYALATSKQRTVEERIRNYLQKYLPVMQEVPAEAWAAVEGRPGTAKYLRSRQAFLASKLDVRPRKPRLPEVEPPVPPVPVELAARGPGAFVKRTS